MLKPRFQCPLDKQKTDRLFQFALILANIVFLIALTIYAVRGFYSRYWADDYCFGSIFHQHGLFEGTGFFYQNTSNRFAAYFLVGLNELLGEHAISFLPAFMILITVFIYSVVFKLAFRLVKFPQKWGVSLLLSQLMTYFMLLTAPDLFQSIFWRSGIVSYYAPIPFLGLTLIIILTGIRHGKFKFLQLVLLALVTFFSAGLSETFAALESGLWLILIVVALIFITKDRRRPILQSGAVALLGSMIAMLIMIKAPGNIMRLETLEQATSLWQVIYLSLRFGTSFLYNTLRGYPLPILILFATSAILAYHLSGHTKPGIDEKTWVKILWGSLITGFILLVCVAAPTAYGMMAYPENRAWMLGRFVSVLAMIIVGFSTGILSHRFMDRIVDTCLMSIIILVLLSLYPFKGAWQEWQQLSAWQTGALAWDARQQGILDSISEGEISLTVQAFDSIGSVAELTANPHYWVNVCAANYYGVEEIIALEVLP